MDEEKQAADAVANVLAGVTDMLTLLYAMHVPKRDEWAEVERHVLMADEWAAALTRRLQ